MKEGGIKEEKRVGPGRKDMTTTEENKYGKKHNILGRGVQKKGKLQERP